MDREQLEFLMSQAIDGQLSDEDAERLERALAADADARAEFERMQRLDNLIGAWGRQPVPVDEDRAGRAMADRVREQAEFAISEALDGDDGAAEELAAYAQRDPDLGLVEHQYRRLTAILGAWGSYEPAVDYDKLHERLCQTIRAERAGQSGGWTGRIIRLYAPLAAAASLLVVAGLWWTGRSVTPPPVRGPAQIQVALAGPPTIAADAQAVVEVSFGLAPDAPIQSIAKASSGSGVVVSVGGFGGPRDASVTEPTEAIF